MIYIKRDETLIPDSVRKVAKRALEELELKPAAERGDFIKKKGHIWRSFARHLAKMSFGKCWYSESKDAGASFDVDHFRPKAEARRSHAEVDAEGYAWLAFEWTNFRLSSQGCNRLNTDDDGLTHGKGSWFPLIGGGKKATWDSRCLSDEVPLLIDPTVFGDLLYIDFDDAARFRPSQHCLGVRAKRIRESGIIYGLNFERMREARHEVMIEVKNMYETLIKTVEDLSPLGDAASMDSIELQMDAIRRKSRADAKFSRAVRVQLSRLGAADLIDRSLDAGEA